MDCPKARYYHGVSLLRYVLRRLILALPTLVGISLVSFGLIHLAPGDATETGALGAGRPLSEREAAAQRRIFFLDLPAFYNPRPRGLGARLQGICDGLRAKTVARRARARQAATRCGTLCLVPVFFGGAECAGIPSGEREWAQTLIRALTIPEVLPAGTTGTQWHEALRNAFAPAKLARLADKIGRDPAALKALVSRGSAALPWAMRVLLRASPDSPDAFVASAVAARFSGISALLTPRDTPDEAREKLKRWRLWWRHHRRDYVRFGPHERFWGHITETQYGKWVGRIVRLDFGRSLRDGRLVSDKIADALPITLLLSALAMFFAYLLAVPIGVHAATRRGSRGERIMTGTLFVLYSLPAFWVAMLLIVLFGGVGLLDVFPIHGLSSAGAENFAPWTWFLDRVWHLVLPVFTLTYGSLAVLSRYQRGAMIEALGEDYVRTARAKGLSERRVVWGHALPNALLPTITILGLHFPFLISGSVIIERIFNIPGMGLLTFDAFLQRDTPVIMAVMVISASMTLVGLIVSDILYALIDPRIALSGRSRLFPKVHRDHAVEPVEGGA